MIILVRWRDRDSQGLSLQVLTDCERVIGIEDRARLEFARGDDPVEVFERHKRLWAEYREPGPSVSAEATCCRFRSWQEPRIENGICLIRQISFAYCITVRSLEKVAPTMLCGSPFAAAPQLRK